MRFLWLSTSSLYSETELSLVGFPLSPKYFVAVAKEGGFRPLPLIESAGGNHCALTSESRVNLTVPFHQLGTLLFKT